MMTNCWVDFHQSLFSINTSALFSACNATFTLNQGKRKEETTQETETRRWQTVQPELERAVTTLFFLWTLLDLSTPFHILFIAKRSSQNFLVSCWEIPSVQDLQSRRTTRINLLSLIPKSERRMGRFVYEINVWVDTEKQRSTRH